jgi:hypothetical protein
VWKGAGELGTGCCVWTLLTLENVAGGYGVGRKQQDNI